MLLHLLNYYMGRRSGDNAQTERHVTSSIDVLQNTFVCNILYRDICNYYRPARSTGHLHNFPRSSNKQAHQSTKRTQRMKPFRAFFHRRYNHDLSIPPKAPRPFAHFMTWCDSDLDIFLRAQDGRRDMRLASGHSPLAVYWRHVISKYDHGENYKDLICSEKPSCTNRVSTSVCSPSRVRDRSVALISLDESGWIKVHGRITPDGWVAKNLGRRNQEYRSPLQIVVSSNIGVL